MTDELDYIESLPVDKTKIAESLSGNQGEKYYEKLYVGKLPIAFSVTPAVRMWNNGIPLKIDTYRTCSNSCHYCFATVQSAAVQHRNGIRYNPRIIRYMKPNELIRLEKRLHANDGFTGWALKNKMFLEIGTLSEPFQETDRLVRSTWNALNFCRKHEVAMMFNTKGNLLIKDQSYFDLVVSHPAPVLMNVTLITTDEELSKSQEPFDNTPLERFELIKRMRDKKIPTVVYFAPFMPGISDFDLDRFVKMSYDYGAVGIHLRTFYITGKMLSLNRWKKYIKANEDKFERHGYGHHIKTSYLLEIKKRMEDVAAKLDSKFKIVGLKADLFEQKGEIIHGRIPMDAAPKKFQESIFDFTVIPILRKIKERKDEPQLLFWDNIGHKENKMNYPEYVYLTGEDESAYMLSGGQRSPTCQSAGKGRKILGGYDWVKLALWNGVMKPGYIQDVSMIYPVVTDIDRDFFTDGNGDKVFVYIPSSLTNEFITEHNKEKVVLWGKTVGLLEPKRAGDTSDLYNKESEWYDEFDRWS